jgi:transposase
MAMGSRERRRKQQSLWVATADLPRSDGHPFYARLNEFLDQQKFDEFCEGQCARFYARKVGRPGLMPGIYFRLLMLGYFEGIESERGIAWRAADSLSLRGFLRLTVEEESPDHSTISRTRRLIEVETHQAIFGWILQRLAETDLLRGKTVGVDGTTLEANAAMRSIVRRDTGEGYEEFLVSLAKASGIETPTRDDLARIDRKRKNKGSNQDWHNPNDPDGRITKMKDGSTHLAHKVEHAVDMQTGAVLAVVLHHADQGDTATIMATLACAGEQLAAVQASTAGERIGPNGIEEAVADKGYLSDEVLRQAADAGVRTYIPEKHNVQRDFRGRPGEKQRFLANRRRIRGARGKALLRSRGELIERSFAHAYETGGMRRTHLRRHPNILKRLHLHLGAHNLALLMRRCFGLAKPRALQGKKAPESHAGALKQCAPRLLAMIWPLPPLPFATPAKFDHAAA